MMPLLSSFVVVALAEMGDKTQLIALTLGLRFRHPWTVMLGILIATILNHALASALGAWGAARLGGPALGWVLGISFIVFGVWTLIPDKADAPSQRPGWGPLLTTTIVFFFAEMGDKTQLATVALGARYADLWLVALGTTLGMMLANIPAVLVGEALGARFPLARMRFVAAALFAVAAVVILLGVDLGWVWPGR